MTGLKPKVYKPNPRAHRVYKRLYALYHQLHDAFGVAGSTTDCHNVMKQLLDIRAEARK